MSDLTEAEAIARIVRLEERSALTPGYGTTHYILGPGETIGEVERERDDLIKETLQAHDVATFVALANRGLMPQSELFYDRTKGRIEFIVDYHSAAAESDEDNPITPGLKWHRVAFQRIPSLAWEAWQKNDGVKLSQDQFVEFLDERYVDVLRPSSATMLEMARSFHATRTAQFSRATQIANGDVQFQFRQQTNAGAGDAGTLEVPSEFTIGVEPWFGAPLLELRALFRYRISDEGVLKLFYVFSPNPVEIVQRAVDAVARDIAEKLATTLHLAVIP